MIKKQPFLMVAIALFIILCFSVIRAFAVAPLLEVIAMANKIADVNKFSVTIRMGYDVVQDNGQKIEFGEVREVSVLRPYCLKMKAKQSDGDINGVVFDGKIFTQYSLKENVYARLRLIGDIDRVVKYAVAKFGVRVPLARMLVTTFPEEIRKLTKEVVFVERDVLGDVPTYHIAGRTDDVDYQVWIADDNLPRRIVLTYKNEVGQPQFWANFYNWDLNPSLTKEDFIFKPPKGAEEIPFVVPVEPPKAGQGGSKS